MNTEHMTYGCTADVAPRERLDYWQHLFGSVWGDVDITPRQNSDFFGRIVSQRFGSLAVNTIEFGGQKFHRSQKQVRKVDIPFYSFAFPAKGQADCQIGDTFMHLKPGSAFLLNNNLPSRLQVKQYYQTNNIQIPVNDLEARVGSPLNLKEFPDANHSAISFLLRQLLDNLLNSKTDVSNEEAEFLSDKILDSIAFFLNFGKQETNDTQAQSAHRDYILAYIYENYWREDLSPREIALKCGLSVSYLHRLFRYTDQTVMQFVRTHRLTKAEQMLKKSEHRHLSIGDIAHYCGFRSHAEFTRSFSALFGYPPSQNRE